MHLNKRPQKYTHRSLEKIRLRKNARIHETVRKLYAFESGFENNMILYTSLFTK